MDTQQEETPSNTLFISEVPADISEEEFARIFETSAGVQGTRLKLDRNNRLVGFVDFDTEENAVAVKTRVTEGKFNAVSNAGMNVHYARQATRNRSENSSLGGRSRNNNNSQRSQGYDNYNSNRGGDRSGRGGNVYNYSPFPYSGHPYSGSGGSGQPLPQDASSTLYVEGVAHDAIEREVAHIFRPFPGFQLVRMLHRESRKYPDSTYLLCFIEFDNKHQATAAMQMLQGYKFDRADSRGLRISYATNNSNKNNNNNNNSGNNNNRRRDMDEPREQEDD